MRAARLRGWAVDSADCRYITWREKPKENPNNKAANYWGMPREYGQGEREGGSCDDDYIPPLLFLRGSSEVRGWDRAQSPDAFNLPSRLSCFLSLSFSPATAVTFRHHPLTSKGCWLFARSFLQSTERERGMLSTSRVSFMDITRIIPRSMVFFKWTDEIPF